MTPEQKQRAQQILRRFEQADPRTRQADNAAVDMAALLQELIAEQPASVPDGWKLAPANATVDMIVDGLNARYVGGSCDEGTMARRMYKGMLSAAPEAPAVRETWSAEQCAQVLATLRYIQGIAERGEGRPMREDETLEQFLLGYVKRLEVSAVQPHQSEHHLEMVKDAERYRYLRACNSGSLMITHLIGIGDCDEIVLTGNDADEAIDAAIAAEKGGA